MSDTTNTQRPWYFNLKADGDTAVVRLLHSKADTIESVTSHRIIVDGKPRRVKCLGENCPLCKNGAMADERIYVHLFDYTDNKEKVWERTDKILPTFKTIEKDWTPLNSAVLRITRKGNEFPKYDVVVLNPSAYANVDGSLVDKTVAKLYSFSRNADEIETFIKTGAFPERKEFIPKEEYKKMKEAEKAQATATQSISQSASSNTTMRETEPFVDDPFVDDFVAPKRF